MRSPYRHRSFRTSFCAIFFVIAAIFEAYILIISHGSMAIKDRNMDSNKNEIKESIRVCVPVVVVHNY